MNIFAAIAISVTGAILILVLKKKNPEISFVLSVCVVIVLLLAAISKMPELISKLEYFARAYDTSYLAVPLKALGISLAAGVTASLCEDAGEKSIAFAVKTVSKISIILVALPLFEELLGQIAGILGV